MKFKSKVLFLALSAILVAIVSACSAEPVEVEVEVTRIVETEVEVAVETEVTREVEVEVAVPAETNIVNVYSSRHYGDLEAPFVAFTEATGIEVRVSAGSPRDLLNRLRADIARGDRSVADVFLAIDAGVLSLAAEEGLLQPHNSDAIASSVSEGFQDPDGLWAGLSIRTRTLVYNPANTTEDEIAAVNSYSDLADPNWAGRLCMRPASHIYTVSLFSSLINNLGEAAALESTTGIANNVTRYINSDTGQIRAVAAGECDVAVVNHYYMGRLANGDAADQDTFNAVQLKWMNQGENGVFFNVNGAGVVANAENFDNAVAFIEYLAATENQCGAPECFPGSNFEFPTNPEAAPNDTIAGFGDFNFDLDYSLWNYGSLQEASVAMLEESGYGFAEVVVGEEPTMADGSNFVNVYSSRHYGDLEAPFVAFTEATGIEVRVSAGSPRDLLNRLRADIARGERSVADVFLAIDAGVLSLAAEEGLLQPHNSDAIASSIAPEFQDPDGLWAGLSIRTRTLVFNPANTTEEEIAAVNSYSDLADPNWAGRLCMRPASHIYTVSLFSSLINNLGEAAALEATTGIANNVTRYINSDTGQIRAVAAGECDVAVVNHYYMGRLANGDAADQDTFNAVQLKWMNQGENGVFFNVNGAGVVANAANFDNAVAFIEYLAATENQCGAPECFPGSNFEFPTNPEAAPNDTIAGFGDFGYDLVYGLSSYGSLQEASVAMLEAAGYGFSEN
ncbi:MAG: extracellular solute-binding protein [Chloroflexota bacterium]